MITVSGLYKTYGNIEALKGISFDIKKGEFYGLLGPNGAGKTTTISILSTVLKPDQGNITIAGFDLKNDPSQCKKKIGVVPQEIALYNELSAYDNLMFWGKLYNTGKSEVRTATDETLKLFGLYDRRNEKIKTYSGGMKRRINIASALLHRPEILFMDEPTVGIDPQSRNLIFEVLEKLHRDGLTIIYTTHYMEEAERFCDRIGIIDNGEIIAEGTLEELKKNSSIKESIVISFDEINDDLLKDVSQSMEDFKRIDNTLHFYSSDISKDLPGIVMKCSQAGLSLSHIDVLKVNLETIFLNLTGKQLRD